MSRPVRHLPTTVAELITALQTYPPDMRVGNGGVALEVRESRYGPFHNDLDDGTDEAGGTG